LPVSSVNPQELFHQLGGLTQPGMALVAKPQVQISNLQTFFDGFDPALEFNSYLQDSSQLSAGAQLCKMAGQTCYASFSPKRTMNAQAARYFENIMSSGHGSVLEHATYSFFLYGLSRSLTHEMIRHRAGFGYSQLSQRYVSGRVLRFVERPEFQDQGELHEKFLQRIDAAYAGYHSLAERLLQEQRSGAAILTAEARTDLRKKVNQAARAVLPNETETLVVATANVRAWRHFIEMRGSAHSELEIRALAVRIFLCLRELEPILFGDYQLTALPDGTHSVATTMTKV
jgi:thymidylate synthase (FAD)